MSNEVFTENRGVFSPFEKSLWLHRICEANYRRLLILVRDFDGLESTVMARARDPSKPPLRLRVLERSVFTLEIELSHEFGRVADALGEPGARVRVCLDAKTVEMLSDQDRPAPSKILGQDAPLVRVLDYKWSLNYFLMRWLDHFVAEEYAAMDVPA